MQVVPMIRFIWNKCASPSPKNLCYPPLGFLPVGQHVLDVAVVLCVQILCNLLLCQPLEVLQILGVDGQIGLASHNARFHEEDLATGGFDLGAFSLFSTGWFE